MGADKLYGRENSALQRALDKVHTRRNVPEAFGLLVLLGSMHHCTSTCSLSTWSSPTALNGVLISEPASHLDAFSAYPFRT